MSAWKYKVAVAGHICLDVIPEITNCRIDDSEWMAPGRLNDVGPAIITTGGAVANTGIALHRLGANVKLMGKIGDDLFGQAIMDKCLENGDHLVDHMIVAKGEASSYTIVLSTKGSDRILLHCSGTNDTFTLQDLSFEELSDVAFFHFGYPPLMYNMYADDGQILSEILQKVKSNGIMTSLDMAMPDEEAEAGKADWKTVLSNTLPYVDIFLPSFEEILFMIKPEEFLELQNKYGSAIMLDYVDGNLLSSVAEELIDMGAKTVILKLGEHGLYMRSSSKEKMDWLHFLPEDKRGSWTNRELLMPSFEVDVQGTTGAGDCTIAGFITCVLHHLSPEKTLQGAVGVGGFNVEKADATSGIVSWEETKKRIDVGWKQRKVVLPLVGWRRATVDNVWIGPNDQRN
ncbi:carbohydrate kinase family protein [Virgibacillus sp. W0181]|uniref:carbohydrate kinase family protein n=1 Tax=Virgibacillus sp. W0181 TaxID=3391581 RepID=UPI003F455738